MDIHHLKVFASVYKHKSFSIAAEELNLTQPTVSDHIKALEVELNCKLFDRLPRKIIPTREAAVLIVRAQEIIERVEGFKDVLARVQKRPFRTPCNRRKHDPRHLYPSRSYGIIQTEEPICPL